MNFIENVVRAYRKRSLLSIASLFGVVLAAVTVIWFQEIRVSNLDDFFAIIQQDDQRKKLILTAMLNLLAVGYLGANSIFWIKAVFTNNKSEYGYSYYRYDYQDVLTERIVYLLMSVIFGILTYVFLSFLLNKLSGIIWLIVLGVFFVIGNSNSNKN
ncbi:hypothetical protein J41TS12_23290 [Paenibacillus antibioticophila]|uniref:Uncharacterized protein n=1 Tax=Paenibacillus antibioticophila TaxID=1274374 RepID=A0A920CH60_9BACL|nr:hypothetical protein [Paenibacillus antibioticophila]GIO37468.1 hypothetical protein J41TS12_23290 [Paenibacillus antibioticophila]